MPARSGMTRRTRGGADAARRLTPSGEIWTAAEREARGDDRGDRDADDDERDVAPLERKVAPGKRRSSEGDVVEQRPEQEEEGEPEPHSGDGRNRRLDRGDDRDLTRRGADETHRREALLPPGGGQPARRRDQDEHGQQERDGSTGQNELQHGSAPDAVLAGVAVSWRALDASDLDRPWDLRELARLVTDHDDQRVRGWKCRGAEGANLAAGKPVAQLVRRFGPKKGREGRRSVVLTRPRQVRNPRGDRSVGARRGNVDSVDRLVAELVGAGKPPKPVGCRGRR